MTSSLKSLISGLWSHLIGPVHRNARLVPAVAYGGDGPEPARHDEVQALRVFYRLDRIIVVLRVDAHRDGALRTPVAAALEAALLAHCQLAQPSVHVGP